MAYPRSQLISDEEPGFYHCVSRCVRRAFLCGVDERSGKSFEHRRQWIEDRIFKVAESFAVSVYAYAVMSNHLHVVMRSDPAAPWQWSDREVADRWLAVFPGSISNRDDPACVVRATLALLDNAERLNVIRQRLGSISCAWRTHRPHGQPRRWLYGAILGRSFQVSSGHPRNVGSDEILTRLRSLVAACLARVSIRRHRKGRSRRRCCR